MSRSSCSLPIVAVVLALVAGGCGAEVDDGIFDPGVSGSAPGSGGTDGTGDGSESGDPDEGSDGAGDASTSGANDDVESTDEAGSTGASDEGTCPQVADEYQCPEGSTFSSSDGWARCTFEGLLLPATPTLSAYCQYLDEGYLGFSWSLSDVPAHECAPEARYAPSSDTGYCLWEDIVLPPGMVQDECGALAATNSLGFRWPCPPA